MNRKLAVLTLFSIVILNSASAGFPATPKLEAESKSETSAEDAIRDVLIGESAALNAEDSGKAVSFWAPDAVFIDQFGGETRGFAELKERFAKALKQHKANSISIHPEKISFPAANVALVIGSASRKDGEADIPSTRLSLIFVKQNGAWLINQANETSIKETRACDHLRELAWLIGKWQVDNPGAGARLDVDWGAGHNFIVSKTIFDKDGMPQIDTQIIGWDPRANKIVSWHFDCNGGFGNGTWTHENNRWIVDFAGVAADGHENRATNVFSLKDDPNAFTWQSTNQNANGVSLADTDILNVKKAKP